jgi:hypothetical protein
MLLAPFFGVVNNLARADLFTIFRGGVSSPVAEIGLFGVLRAGVDAINLIGVETNFAGVPSETADLDTTPLSSSHNTWSLVAFDVTSTQRLPEASLPTKEFLLNGDGTMDSTFTTGLTVLTVAALTEDPRENLLVKDRDMCDITEGCPLN